MKNIHTLFIAVLLITISCKKNENPDPTLPANSYRIKEILTKEGGKDYSKTIFTYEGEKLVKKGVIPLQPIEDLAYTETFTYGNNTVTKVVEGFLRTKTITILGEEKIKSVSQYDDDGGTFELQSYANVIYDGNKINTIHGTNYNDSDSSIYTYEFIYSENKLQQLKIGYSGENIYIISRQTEYQYEGNNIGSQVETGLRDSIWINLFKMEYIYSKDKIIRTYYYMGDSDEQYLSGGWFYDYNENGYLGKKYDSKTDIYYTYEEGNGNTSNLEDMYFNNIRYPAPNYISGHLEASPSPKLNQKVVQQILQTQI